MPDPRPLSAIREKQIRDLPKLIRRHAWTAAEDAADAIRDLVAEVDRLRAERPEGTEPDLSGWSVEENAEFEELYGVQAAMRLRASNNRVWQIVHELRSKAAGAGLDPYQDPMAQRLAAALVHPEPEETVLQEHAAMKAELEAARAEIERQRVEREALVAGYDLRGHEIAGLRRGLDARQAGLPAELEQRQAAPVVTVGGGCEGCCCCSRQGCHRFADATCPTNSLGDSVCPCTED